MRRLPQLFAALTVAMAVAASAMAQAPAPAASAVASVPLARYIPKEGLFAYLEVQGVEAKADEWGKTAAAKILNDTSTGAMLDDLMVQLLDRMFASMPAAGNPGFVKPTGEEYMGLIRHGLKAGMVFGIQARPGDPNNQTGTVVFKGAMRDDTSKRTFAALIRGITPAGGKTTKVVKPGNRSVAAITRADGTPELTFWVENKQDLVLTNDPDGVIASLDGKAKNVSELPAHAEIFAPSEGFVPIAGGWMDIDALPPAPPQVTQFFSQMDLKGVKRVDVKFGMRGEALMHELRLVAPSPRTGTLAMLDQPTFDLKSMPPLPSSATEFSAFTIDLPKLYTQIQTLVAKNSPQAEAAFQQAEAMVKARTKLRLKEDILSRLGPKMAVYALPKAKASGGLLGSLGGGGVQVPKGAMLIEIKDAKGTTTMIDQLMIFANKEIKTQMAAMAPPTEPAAGSPGRRPTAAPPAPEFKVTLNNPKTYVLNLPTQFAAMTNLRLTVAVGKKYLVIASMPDAAKDALTAESKTSDTELAEGVAKAVEGLPEGLTMITVSDPSDTLPEGLAKLPTTLNLLATPPALGPPPGGQPGQSGPAPEAGQLINPGAGPQRGGRGGRGAPIPGGGGNEGGGDGPVPTSMILGATVGQVPPGPGAGLGPITIDPAKIPSPDAIRPLLFPGASALVVDETSIRYIAKYAFPDFAGVVEGIAASRSLPGMIPGGAAPGMPAPGGRPAGGPAGRGTPPGRGASPGTAAGRLGEDLPVD